MSQQGGIEVNRASPAPPVCARCGREITTDQQVEHAGGAYCTNCVGAALDAENARRQEASGSGHVYAAVLLSLMPGLGQMYNGQMLKGLAVLAGFFFIATGHGPFSGDLQGAAIVVLYAWNLFDAYWTAQRIRHVRPPVVSPLPEEQPWESAAAPFWGILLIGLGIIFLLYNYGVEWLTFERTWPAALLALGLWLLVSFALSWRTHDSTREAHHGNTS